MANKDITELLKGSSREEELKALLEKNKNYLDTPEGIATINEALRISHERSEELRRGYNNISWEQWFRPFGPADGSGVWYK